MATPAIDSKPLTVEDMYSMPRDGRKYELIDAVEILSPSDSMTLVEQRVELYLTHGAQLVWVINPKAARATVYRGDGTAAIVRADGALDGETVLPGFSCAIAALL
jgi:Uma2 family endonuclease